MKDEMKMPGFTAEASVYKSSGCYMAGGHESNMRPAVGPAAHDYHVPIMLPGPGGASWGGSSSWSGGRSFIDCGRWCRSECNTDGLCFDLCVMFNC